MRYMSAAAKRDVPSPAEAHLVGVDEAKGGLEDVSLDFFDFHAL
jgi:hypothetical protein